MFPSLVKRQRIQISQCDAQEIAIFPGSRPCSSPMRKTPLTSFAMKFSLREEWQEDEIQA
jgi:hypothetical protein